MRYVIFHLHFYQPPRFNPFVNEIEFQSSAYPFSNWNEKISMECYIPNVYARIFDNSGYIINIINNLEYVSFNFGATLMSWIKSSFPELYRKVIDADEYSIKRLGFGNAIAQVYNHIILPLANQLDKENQVYWAIRDFEYHFGRTPTGMWLPETAVDIESLEVLASYGINFTILAPHQIKRYRKIGASDWIENNGNIPNKPFYVCLPSGKKIIVFAYNSNLSHAVSFQDLLSSGEKLAKSIISEFKDDNDVIVIASDGETYGHHKKFGELGLAYCIYTLLSNPSTKVCNFEFYINNVDILYEAEINENTSWSCFHGLSRWKDNCGCRFDPNTSQEWRRNLRIAIDSVRSTFEEIYSKSINLMEVSDLRKEYIEYLIKRDNDVKTKEDLLKLVCDFMNSNGIDDCDKATKLLNLLEIYKNILFAYTSCGWFFDDISGIEATQNLKFLYWAVVKIRQMFDINLEPVVQTILKDAKSNYYFDGLKVFNDFVKSSCLEKERIVASYIFNKIFLKTGNHFLNCFWDFENFEKYSTGECVVSAGKVKCIDVSDFSYYENCFIFVYLGNLSFYFGLGDFDTKEVFNLLKGFLLSSNIVDIVNLVDSYSSKTFSLNDIFINSRRSIIKKLITSNVKQIDKKIDEIFFEQKIIIRNLVENGFYPIPLEMKLITLLILDNQIENALENFNSRDSYDDILYFIANKDKICLNLDEQKIKAKFEKKLKNMLLKLRNLIENKNKGITEYINNIISFIEFGSKLRLNYNLWESQNIMFSLYKDFKQNREFLSEIYKEEYWNIERKFITLADMLKIRLVV
ncbi:MAG: DUF3536 domain-containing protein [Candidatus Calescibacterium sp.]|nr:DUF3536 domain-containing protein [Candidatus Calescibacterium sp.]MDW8132775.1 DUF3536 domain-containing protein [Candidatus Calescibacterium sp.]